MADYAAEKTSRYEAWWVFGWPYETSVALARLVFSGVMDRLPDLKVVAHYLGGVTPFLEGPLGFGYDELGSRTSNEDYETLHRSLKKRPLDYFKEFYADSVTFVSRAAAACGLSFYGVDRVLFASDCPFDPEKGPGYIRDAIRVLESLDLSPDDLAKLAHRNAETLFHLTSRGRGPAHPGIRP